MSVKQVQAIKSIYERLILFTISIVFPEYMVTLSLLPLMITG